MIGKADVGCLIARSRKQRGGGRGRAGYFYLSVTENAHTKTRLQLIRIGYILKTFFQNLGYFEFYAINHGPRIFSLKMLEKSRFTLLIRKNEGGM